LSAGINGAGAGAFKPLGDAVEDVAGGTVNCGPQRDAQLLAEAGAVAVLGEGREGGHYREVAARTASMASA